MLVVAPVINLSGNQELDTLRLTDLLASECLSFPGVAVTPVNRVLAELAKRGKGTVETPADAADLARTFGADGTLVAAVTEWDPYMPPVVGLTLQLYDPPPSGAAETADALSAAGGPRWQAQRVFNAADEDVAAAVRRFAEDRETGAGPYAWRRTLASAELYWRYCSWSLIRTILGLDESGPAPWPAETRP